MTPATALHRPLDGRQTGGLKGLPYDWQRLLLDDRIEDDDVADEAEHELTFPTMSGLIGLLLT